MNTCDVKNLNSIRMDMLTAAYECGETTHLGGAFSLVELLYVLYAEFLNISPANVMSDNRDIFILSKGHGALGLYSVLKHFCFITEKQYSSFQQNGSKLIAHPVKNNAWGIEASNGSLGQGLSLLAGMALGSKLKSETRSFVTVLGDGECNEGSVWEAAMFCNQYNLSNIVAIIDNNGFQNDDSTSMVSEQVDVAARWLAFGWHVQEIDGHCVHSIGKALKNACQDLRKPSVIIANTVKGRGISFMENNNEWHHNRITEKMYATAVRELQIDD